MTGRRMTGHSFTPCVLLTRILSPASLLVSHGDPPQPARGRDEAELACHLGNLTQDLIRLALNFRFACHPGILLREPSRARTFLTTTSFEVRSFPC